MGVFDRLFGKRHASKPVQQTQVGSAATGGDVSAPTTFGNWRVLSGTDAAREAIAQRVIGSSENFGAVLLTPIKPGPSSGITLTGAITCHGCRGTCPLDEKVAVGGGLGSRIVTCHCGSQITLLISGASIQGAAFVVVSPFTSLRGQTPSQISLRIHKITSEGEGQQEGVSAVRLFDHSSWIGSVAFTHDGARALVGDVNGQLWLWDVESGREVRRWEGHATGKGVESVVVSSDGRRALSGGRDMTARLWDLETGDEVRRLQADDVGPIRAVAFAPDGRHAATGSSSIGIGTKDYRPTLILWDLDSGQEVRRFKGHTNSIAGLAFTPDGNRLFSCSPDETVRVWETVSGKEVLSHAVGAEVISVACSPDGQRLLFGTYGTNLVGLVDVATRSDVQRCKGHTESVKAVAFAPDGRTCLSGSADHTARLWDMENGRELTRFVGQTGWVTCVAFAPDGRFVLVGGYDTVLRLYAVPSR